jgi:P27 family predicted phage terminase small subunit
MKIGTVEYLPAPAAAPPAHLSAESGAFWREMVAAYGIHDPAGVRLLTVACEALDTARAAEREVAANGLTLPCRDGRKTNPAASIMRDSRAQLLQALKQLELLAADDPKPLGRPPGSKSSRYIP